METKTDTLPILVVGSGLAGLTMALTLKKFGVPVEIISPNFPQKEISLDNRTGPKDGRLSAEILYGSGRTTALLQSSHTFLDAIGIWPSVTAQATALKTMSLVDDQKPDDPPITVEFNPTELQDDQISIDAFGYNVSNSILTDALLCQIEKLEIPVHHTAVVGVDIGKYKAKVRCKNGTSIDALLVIGADGANSAVRKLARIDVEEHVFDQLALTLVIKHTKSHDFTSTEFQKHQGPLTLVPLEDNHSSVVWVHRKQRALDYLAQGEDFLLDKLSTETHGLLGELQLVAGPGKFPVISRRAEKMHSGRVALIAEAAHAMPPIGAQGLNSSLMDVSHLSALLIEAHNNCTDLSSLKQLEKLLTSYHQQRHDDIKKRFKAVNTLNYMVTTTRETLSSVRQMGLVANRDSQTIRNFFVQNGMMWQRDLPNMFQKL